MAFLRSIAKPDTAPLILGEGVYLRTPQPGDYAAWAQLRENSRDFLTPWEPTWAQDDLTRTACAAASAAICTKLRGSRLPLLHLSRA